MRSSNTIVEKIRPEQRELTKAVLVARMKAMDERLDRAQAEADQMLERLRERARTSR